MFTIGRIVDRREGVFFPTENALSVEKGGWECTARAKYAIYDCLVYCVICQWFKFPPVTIFALFVRRMLLHSCSVCAVVCVLHRKQ